MKLNSLSSLAEISGLKYRRGVSNELQHFRRIKIYRRADQWVVILVSERRGR